MCKLSIKEIEGEKKRGKALKADVPKGNVLQRVCCSKNFDEKVFTD